MKLKTRTNQPVYYKLPVSSNIQSLSDDLLNSLRVGDVVQKKTGNQKHCYVVTYKEEKHGICLTYVDCGYMETISYDYVNGHWVYNSKDVKEVLGKGDDIQVEGITSKGIANTGGLANIGDVAISGDLSVQGEGKGKITGNEIVENMSGYSATKDTSKTWSPIYVGICKNGNKLTLVVFGEYTYVSGDGSFAIANFTIPQEVGQKLFPYTVGTEVRMLDQKSVSFYSSRSQSKQVKMEINKTSHTNLVVNIMYVGDAGLTSGSSYIFRYEATFLLGENLLGE